MLISHTLSFSLGTDHIYFTDIKLKFESSVRHQAGHCDFSNDVFNGLPRNVLPWWPHVDQGFSFVFSLYRLTLSFDESFTLFGG